MSSMRRRERCTWCRRSTCCRRGEITPELRIACDNLVRSRASRAGRQRDGPRERSDPSGDPLREALLLHGAIRMTPGEVPTSMIAEPLQRSVHGVCANSSIPAPTAWSAWPSPWTCAFTGRSRACAGADRGRATHSTSAGATAPPSTPGGSPETSALRHDSGTDGVRSHQARVLSALCSQRRARTKLRRFVSRAGG